MARSEMASIGREIKDVDAMLCAYVLIPRYPVL